MESKRKLTINEINSIVDFIQPRPYIPPDIEDAIVFKKKKGIIDQLVTIEIYESLIPNLKEEIEKQYINSLIDPGECVGIIGAQSMGEYSTQATLNTFHVAGVDTGSSTGVSRFQDLINASKTVKIDNISLFFKPLFAKKNITELRKLVASKLIEVKLSHLMINSIIVKTEEISQYKQEITSCIELYNDEHFNYEDYESCLKITLSRELLLKHRLHPSVIKNKLEEYNSDCKYAFLPISSQQIIFFIFIYVNTDECIEKIIQDLMDKKICGIDGIIRYDFKRKDLFDDEWYIETTGGSFSNINCLADIFDLTKTKTTSIWDLYNTFGIEATKQFLIQELKTVMDGVDICHIKLLVERMTYSGTIEPITRYTMRNDESPLSRASFEESFETFLKAAKFKEVEPFTGVSASVIGGKKAEVGTYMCDILIDMKKLNIETKEEDYDDDYEENDDLVYIE